MKKIIMVGIAAFLSILAGIAFFSGSITSHTNPDPIRLGYCPTMSDLAKEIASKNIHVSLQSFGYTSEALQALNKGDVDMVLVGRLADRNEVNDPFEKRLKQGLTLVGREKRLISISQLQNSRIHTAVDEDLANVYISNKENIIFHESTGSAIKEGIDEIVLIDWNDYTDGLGLVIPVDDAGNKIEKFRIPVAYSNTERHIENLHTG